MANHPIHLTILRKGDVHIVDLAEVQAIIPRSETRVEGSFLEEISQELKRITNVVGPQRRASVASAESRTEPKPGVADELKDLGSLVFSHLLPSEARNRLRDAAGCDLYLRLDDQLVHLPWELAFDGQQFLGMKFSVGRQVITHHRAAQAPPSRAESDYLRVLIISDPSESLQNVSRESEQLCEILDEIPGLQVRLLGGRSVKRIPLLAALRQSDIVHFAGHSQFDERNPERSGWLLHDGLLSASEISKLDQAPLLVFSNSCQAGATTEWQGTYQYEGEAFGLGSAFLLAGVRNFVGTFCVVHDEESRFLAVEFYKNVAGGKSIGQALLDARRATAYAMGFDRLTWASYMLYGDPAFSLSHAAKKESQTAIPPAEARVSAVQVQPPTFLAAAEPKRRRFRWPRLSFTVSISFTVGMLAVLVFGHLLRTELRYAPTRDLPPAPLQRESSGTQDKAANSVIPSDANTGRVAPPIAGPPPGLGVASPHKESETRFPAKTNVELAAKSRAIQGKVKSESPETGVRSTTAPESVAVAQASPQRAPGAPAKVESVPTEVAKEADTKSEIAKKETVPAVSDEPALLAETPSQGDKVAMEKPAPEEPPSKSQGGIEPLEFAARTGQPKTSAVTPGMVVKTIQKGKTTQAEIMAIFGHPDMVTRSGSGELWGYDKVSREVAEAATGARVGVASASGARVGGGVGGLVSGVAAGVLGGAIGGIGGSSGQTAEQSQRQSEQQSRRVESITTVFLLVYYDDKGVVIDYKMSATKF